MTTGTDDGRAAVIEQTAPEVNPSTTMVPQEDSREVHLDEIEERARHICARAVVDAALLAYQTIGFEDPHRSDLATVLAVRRRFQRDEKNWNFTLRVVGSEGVRDDAPMLAVGEEFGSHRPSDPVVNLVMDTLEGTNLVATSQDNAISIMCGAVEGRGKVLPVPDLCYMDKIVFAGDIDVERLPIGDPTKRQGLTDYVEDLIREIARQRGYENGPRDVSVCYLDKRPRHQAMVERLRALGVQRYPIQDGDVTGGIMAMAEQDEHPLDILLGIGAAPETGFKAAYARKHFGRVLAAFWIPKDDPEKAKLYQAEIERCGLDPFALYTEQDLAQGEVFYALAAVTDNKLMDGVRRRGNTLIVQSKHARTARGTDYFITTRHHDPPRLPEDYWTNPLFGKEVAS